MVRVVSILLCAGFVLMGIQYCTAPSIFSRKKSNVSSGSVKKSSGGTTGDAKAIVATQTPVQPVEVPYHLTPQAQPTPYKQPAITDDYDMWQGWGDAVTAVGGYQEPEESKYAENGAGEYVLKDKPDPHAYRNWGTAHLEGYGNA